MTPAAGVVHRVGEERALPLLDYVSEGIRANGRLCCQPNTVFTADIRHVIALHHGGLQV